MDSDCWLVSALFVERDGIYSKLPHVDPWDQHRDARLYPGPYPVVAHPPCQLWGKFAGINYKRWGGEHNRPGNDGGCFASAVASIRKWGGVLEHPAYSNAWSTHDLVRPGKYPGWSTMGRKDEWVCEVWQSAYGHLARKKTWLLYCGTNPPLPMRWDRPEGTHQIGFHDQRGKERNKPTLSGRAASATPLAFAEALIALARHSRSDPTRNALSGMDGPR